MRRSVLAAADSCRRDIPAQIGGVAPPRLIQIICPLLRGLRRRGNGRR